MPTESDREVSEPSVNLVPDAEHVRRPALCRLRRGWPQIASECHSELNSASGQEALSRRSDQTRFPSRIRNSRVQQRDEIAPVLRGQTTLGGCDKEGQTCRASGRPKAARLNLEVVRSVRILPAHGCRPGMRSSAAHARLCFNALRCAATTGHRGAACHSLEFLPRILRGEDLFADLLR